MTPTEPRVALISHDWSSGTGASRCAMELDAVLRLHPDVRLCLGRDDLPPRPSGPRSLLQRAARALTTVHRLRQHSVDVAIVNTTIQSSMILAARLAGCRVIWWCHESNLSLGSPLMQFRLWLYQRLSHYQVAVSRDVPAPHMSGEMIRNVVRPMDGFPHEGTGLLVLGTKCTRKGVDRLPFLLRPLADDHDISLVVIGADDPRETDLLARARSDLGALWGDRLRWDDATLDPDDAYRRAAVLLLPSRADPRPRVVEEALGRGIPVVASHLAGLEDVALTVQTPGALTLVDDDADWPSAVRRALNFGTSRRSLIAPFSSEDFASAWILVIQELQSPPLGDACDRA